MEEQINGKRVLQELAAVAFAQVQQAYEADGTAVPERAGPALAAVEKTAQGIKLKFYDKMKALELLGKHFGLFDGTGERNQDMKQGILEAFLKEEGDGVSGFECPAEAGDELVEQALVQKL